MNSDSNSNNLPQGGYPHHQQLQRQQQQQQQYLFAATEKKRKESILLLAQQQQQQQQRQQYQQQQQPQNVMHQPYHQQQYPQPPQHQQMAAHPIYNYNPSGAWDISNFVPQYGGGAGFTNNTKTTAAGYANIQSPNVPPSNANINVGSEIDNNLLMQSGFSYAKYAFEKESLQRQSILFNNSLRENDLNYVPQQIPPLYQSLLQTSLQPNPSTILDILDRQIVQGDAKRPRLQQDVTSSPPNTSIDLQLQQDITNAEQAMKDVMSTREEVKQRMERQQLLHNRQLEILLELGQQKERYGTSHTDIFARLSEDMDQAMDDNNGNIDQAADDNINHLMTDLSINEDNSNQQEDFAIKVAYTSLIKMVKRRRDRILSSIKKELTEEQKILAEKNDAKAQYDRLTAETEAKKERYKLAVKAKDEHDQVVEQTRLASAVPVLEQERQQLQRRQNLRDLQEERQERQQQREQQRRLQENKQEEERKKAAEAEAEKFLSNYRVQLRQKKEQKQLQKLLPPSTKERARATTLHNKLQALQLHHHQRPNGERSFDMSNDRTEVINGIRRRERFCDALNKPPATLQASVLQFEEKLPDKQAKIMEINSVLYSVVESCITGKELARRLMEACGLNETGIDRILRRTPSTNGMVQVRPYIRASPNWNDDYLVASVFTQHISQEMAIPLYEELNKVKIDHQAPNIAMDQSRHSGIKSLALALLFYDIIESIENDDGINLKVLATEALRIDERIEAVEPILDALKALKVEGLFLDSMGLDTLTWVKIQTEQRTKNKEVGKVVSHGNAGKRVPLLSGDEDQRLKIFEEADVIKGILKSGDADHELCCVVTEAEKDGATFFENNKAIISQINKLWLKSLEDRSSISAEEVVETFIDEVTKLLVRLDVSDIDIPRLIDYSRFSAGTDEDCKSQQSINMAAGFVLCKDSPTQPRMSIKDVHKSRASSGNLGLATITLLMCMREVERVTLMDPVRIGGRTEDREHQLENLKELAKQTNTTVLFSRCHDQDDEVINDMEGWRQRKRAANNRERKEKEKEVVPKDERKHHGWFASIKTQRLDMKI